MQSLEFEWNRGEVGDYWLRIGLNEKTVHVYQTPWTGENWWVDAELFGITKQTFSSLSTAQTAAESAIERWFGRAIYISPDPDEFWSGGDTCI